MTEEQAKHLSEVWEALVGQTPRPGGGVHDLGFAILQANGVLAQPDGLAAAIADRIPHDDVDSTMVAAAIADAVKARLGASIDLTGAPEPVPVS